jgi:hypothetical protein
MHTASDHDIFLYTSIFEPDAEYSRLARNPHMMRTHCKHRVIDSKQRGEWHTIIALARAANVIDYDDVPHAAAATQSSSLPLADFSTRSIALRSDQPTT